MRLSLPMKENKHHNIRRSKSNNFLLTYLFVSAKVMKILKRTRLTKHSLYICYNININIINNNEYKYNK